MRRLVPVILLFLMALSTSLVTPQASAASPPTISHSKSISCVLSASCGLSLSVTLKVSQGDTILVFTSNYVEACLSPAKVHVVDSVKDAYSLISEQKFQFAACGAQLTPAFDHQYVFLASARETGKLTVKVKFSVAPYEADLVVDDIAGGKITSYSQASCNGSEVSYCLSSAGTIGIAPYTPPSNALVIAYGSASSYMTIYENPLHPGPGYTTDQGPVYPGGYMLDSLTEYSAASGSTTAPIMTSVPTDGWGEIATTFVVG